MRKRMILWAALLGAVAAMFSCQKAQDVAPASYSLSIEATKGDDGEAVKGLTLDGNRLIPSWKTTENVFVKKGDTWASGSLHPETNTPRATLKGTLSGVTLAANNEITLQFPKRGPITYNGQQGTLADIEANYDWATATATVESVAANGEIIVADNVTFVNHQAIVKFTLKNSSGAALNATNLQVVVTGPVTTDSYYIDRTETGEINEFYVALPGFSNKTVTLIATGSDNKTYTYSRGGVTFANGTYYTRDVKLTQSNYQSN